MGFNITDQVPYADVVVGVALLIWNGVERFRRKKTEKGLFATVRAIKSVLNDPTTKTHVDKIKSELSKAHDSADVTPLIKSILAKI